METPRFGFTSREWRALRALRGPAGIQRLLDAMPYHLAQTAWSPRRVLQARTAHCLEGAIFAAAALRVLGLPPLLLDLEAVQDTDHVVAVFRIGGRWGAIAKSNFAGLRYREPVYRDLRELVMSYFEGYMNLRGERTLRAYSPPAPSHAGHDPAALDGGPPLAHGGARRLPRRLTPFRAHRRWTPRPDRAHPAEREDARSLDDAA